MEAPSLASERRSVAAARYRPERVHTLLVAEAPPAAEDRYFYFEDVREQDSLFRFVARGVLAVEPTRTNKAELLGGLRSAGVFLIDVSEQPIKRREDLMPCVPGLVERVRALEPNRVVLIKATVYDVAYRPLARAALPVVDERIPFPGSGNQRKFEVAFARALGGSAPT